MLPRFLFSVLIACFGLALVLFSPGRIFAADHLDAPSLTSPGGDPRLDINDVYAFQSPADSSNVVFIITVNPLAGIVGSTTFRSGASYDLKIDTNGDAREDVTYKVTFSPPNVSGVQKLLLRRVPARHHASVVAKGLTGQNIAVAGGGTVRANVFDDPFFFDLAAFLGQIKHAENGRSFCDGNAENFFLGKNVTAIVLEIPRNSLGSNNIGVWARTELSGDQVDRMGRPAINTVFIPTDQKNAFNLGQPRNDKRNFSQFFGSFANVLLPDILTINTASSAGFLNGRRLQDDVIDIELGLLSIPPSGSDCVGNDSAFTSTFPYLAPAN
jgi:uncharacterized protein DUF4331